MKKTLSIILTLCMILSICTFSVAAAPEGTAITDEAGFLAMDPAGSYYLANDIVLTKSYEATFTGTLDGNGKTVSTSAPLFVTLGGTVKNLTTEGAISYTVAEGETAPDCGVVAVNGTGTVTFENVTNKASITGANAAAALLARTDTTAVVTATGCCNEGNLSSTSVVAGLIALVYNNTATVTDCVNNGELTSSSSLAGGIVGRFGADSAKADVDKIIITNCVNNGTVTGDSAQSGGILAFLVGGAEIKNCVNNGKIVNVNNMAGGIFGTTKKDTKNVCALNIENCINNGDVYGVKVIAGIAARLGRAVQFPGLTYRISGCINYGDIYTYTSPATAQEGVTVYISGIAGYAYGGSKTPANEVSNCVNVGNLYADRSHVDSASTLYIGGVIGYVNALNFITKNNINAGTVTVTGGEITGIGNVAYNKKEAPEAVANNYSTEILAGTTASDTWTTVVTADKLASGEIAYLINEAAGETIYYQAIGTDKAPVLVAAEDGSNTILKNADGTYGNPVKEPETTEPAPETTEPAPETTEPPVGPATGDSFVIFAVIAVISVLGVAVVAKRREN